MRTKTNDDYKTIRIYAETYIEIIELRDTMSEYFKRKVGISELIAILAQCSADETLELFKKKYLL